MKIGIAGVGGIGSNVAVNLVRAGIKNFKIADFDKIVLSNLNRQFYFKEQIGNYKTDMLYDNLKKIDDTINIEKKNIKLDSKNMKDYFSDCDILVEGFDVKETKKDFLEIFGDSGKFIVSANGIGGTNLEKITVKKLGNKIYIVGDFISDISIYKTFPTKVSIIAAMMANIILEKCFGVNENV